MCYQNRLQLKADKVWLTLICVALTLLFMPVLVCADSEDALSNDWGNVRWEFDGAKLTFTMEDRLQTSDSLVYMPNETIRQSVKRIEFKGGPVTVRQDGFVNCPKLETVWFEETAPGGLEAARAFQGCTSLVSVGIGAECTSIGNGCFYGCTVLEDVYPVDETQNVPRWKVTKIGAQAFLGCAKLDSYSVYDLFNMHFRVYEDATYHDYRDYSLQSIGAEAFKGCTALTEVTIPQFADTVGKEAFMNCTNLVSVTFACEGTFNQDGETVYNGASKIGAGAFYGCTKLERVTLPSTLRSFERAGKNETDRGVFEGCTALAQVTTLLNGEKVQGLPRGVIGVLYNTFNGCQALSSSINIPAGVTELNRTFADCKNLAQVSFAENGNLTKIISGFQSCALTQIAIPPTVTDLDGAFSSCTSLTSVSVPEGVTNLEMAFSGCANLETVTLPDTAINLRNAFNGCAKLKSVTIPSAAVQLSYAFYGCKALRSAEIPEGFTGAASYQYLGRDYTGSTENAFYGCTSLTSVSLPDTLQKVGISTFNGCTALTRVTIPAKVTEIGASAFSGCTALGSVAFAPASGGGGAENLTVGNYAFKNCGALTAIRLPDYVTEIGQEAFRDCIKLAEVNFPKALTRISTRAFENTALEQADLSAVRTSGAIISTYAFSGCKNLKTVSIGSGVRTIDYYAFYNCSNLENLTLGEGISVIGERAFYGTKLKDVTFPENLESIGTYAMPTLRYARFRGRGACPSFRDCAFWYSNNRSSVTVQCHRASKIEEWARSLDFKEILYWGTALELPDNLQRIEGNAFIGIKVESIIVPKDVTYIGHLAFSNLSAEGTVTVEIKADPAKLTIEPDAFEGSNVLISAPAGFASKYPAGYFGETVTIK